MIVNMRICLCGVKHDSMAMMYAAEKGHATIVEALIAAGADVNAKDEVGRPPLMACAVRHVLLLVFPLA